MNISAMTTQDDDDRSYLSSVKEHPRPPQPQSNGQKTSFDPNEEYRKTQSQILSLQETILDSSRKQVKGPEYVRTEVNGEPDKGAGMEQVNINQVPSAFNRKVDSMPILQYTRNKYRGKKPRIFATLTYNPVGAAIRDMYSSIQSHETQQVYSMEVGSIEPFLPAYSRDKINKLVTVHITCEQIKDYLEGNSIRALSNELWGTDIYTDDSDPLLVLAHLGLFDSSNNSTFNDNYNKRTPANIDNADDVQGTITDIRTQQYDIMMTILLLDTLQTYQSSERSGIRSRDWLGPEMHDGLSYGVYKIRIIPRNDSVDPAHWY